MGDDAATITVELTPEFASILTPEAAAFIVRLEREFGRRRRELLQKRETRQREIDAGRMPEFLPETEAVRQGDWSKHGLDRCRNHGQDGFERWVGLGVIANNLTMMAKGLSP